MLREFGAENPGLLVLFFVGRKADSQWTLGDPVTIHEASADPLETKIDHIDQKTSPKSVTRVEKRRVEK